MTKALVTGVCGFVGTHLAVALIEKGYDVYGIDCAGSGYSRFSDRLKKEVTFFECDITDNRSVVDILNRIDADVIFHLAGIAHVPFAGKNIDMAFNVNVVGTSNILDAVKSKPDCQVIYISSSEVYAKTSQENMPYTENHALSPSNIYGVSKYSAEMVCGVYREKWGVRSIIFRPFNHIGPGQSPVFVASDFARQIASIEKGLGDAVMWVGNLSAERDFSDVRDIVCGYILAYESNLSSGEIFNICSGKAVSIKSILDRLLSLSSVKIDVRTDKNRLRPNENPLLCGSYAKLRDMTGWEPSIPLNKSLEDILNFWRKNG